MNDRLLFPGMPLFKKTIIENMISSLQHVYQNHPVYTYQIDETKTNILIFPTYGDIDAPGKQPKFVVQMGSYTFSLMDTLGQNFSYMFADVASGVSGTHHEQVISTTITIVVKAYAEEECSDMADELSVLVSFACRETFAQKGILIRGVQVAETALEKQDSNLFQTVVSFSVDVPWMLTRGTTEVVDGVDIEFDPPSVFETLQSPGVTVYPYLEEAGRTTKLY